MGTEQIALSDGRTLAWDEYGATDSATVLIHNHGMGSSRLEPALYESLFTDIGLRVVVPDRPGYGLSTGLPAGRPLIAWADDVAQLVAALGLERFATSGYSGGGRHALALAASDAVGARVSRVIVQAGNAPDQPLERDRDREITEMVATLPTIVPISHAHALHAGLPDSTLHVLPGDGHFSISRHFPDQVAVLVPSP